MALSKTEIARRVLVLLNDAGINLEVTEKQRLKEQNVATIMGVVCKVANTMTPSRFNATVNKNWFNDSNNYDKLSFRNENRGPSIDFDYLLFPAKNKLFAIHYLSLREHCLALELDRRKWFSKSTWGIELDEHAETFNWAGGNRKKFKLTKISSNGNFIDQPPTETPDSIDIAEPKLPDRSLLSTYRILRDTKISRKIKSLYKYK